MKNLWTFYNHTSNRVGGLTPDEASELIAKAKEDMINLKERLDKERQKQETALAKRLGDMKRKKLNQMVRAPVYTYKEIFWRGGGIDSGLTVLYLLF